MNVGSNDTQHWVEPDKDKVLAIYYGEQDMAVALTRVQAPLSIDLSGWKEFDSITSARTYYNVPDETTDLIN